MMSITLGMHGREQRLGTAPPGAGGHKQSLLVMPARQPCLRTCICSHCTSHCCTSSGSGPELAVRPVEEAGLRVAGWGGRCRSVARRVEMKESVGSECREPRLRGRPACGRPFNQDQTCKRRDTLEHHVAVEVVGLTSTRRGGEPHGTSPAAGSPTPLEG
jgi:hypothetical protein